MMPPRSFERAARALVLLAGDILIGGVSLAAIVWLRRNVDVPWTRTLLPAVKFSLTFQNVFLFAASFIVALSAAALYNQTQSRRHRPSILVAAVIQAAILGVATTLTETPWPRSVVVFAPIFAGLIVKGWRLVLNGLWKLRWPSLVIVGPVAQLRSFFAEVADDRVEVEGVVSIDESLVHAAYVGLIDNEPARIAIIGAEEVLGVGMATNESRLRLLVIRGPRGFLFVPNPGDAMLATRPFGSIGDLLLYEMRMRAAYGMGEWTKRCFDLAVGSLLLVVGSPLLLLIALAIFIESGRPVLFRHTRAGRDGRPFGLWKFRSMWHVPASTEQEGLTNDEDERVTRIGLWLRRYRLDELPQLYNVLAGEMSLIGPRPETPELTRRISEQLPSFGLRLLARPGLAGLAQVSGEYDQPASAKLIYDLQYLSSWSLMLDVRILLQAFATSMSGRGV